MQQHMTINTIYTYTEKKTRFFFFVFCFPWRNHSLGNVLGFFFCLSGLIEPKDKQLFGLQEVSRRKVTCLGRHHSNDRSGLHCVNSRRFQIHTCLGVRVSVLTQKY